LKGPFKPRFGRPPQGGQGGHGQGGHGGNQGGHGGNQGGHGGNQGGHGGGQGGHGGGQGGHGGGGGQGHGGGGGGGKGNRAPDQTLQEVQYLKGLIERQVTVCVKLRNNEEVHGVIEYYDNAFIRVTRNSAPNLFIFKHEIKYLYEDVQ